MPPAQTGGFPFAWLGFLWVVGVPVLLSAHPALLLATCVAGCLGLAGLALVDDVDRLHVAVAFLVALVLRLLVAAWLTETHTTADNPAGLFHRDSHGYHRVGTTLASILAAGTQFRVEYHTTGYSLSFHHIVGYVYHWLGANANYVKALNCLLGAATVVLTYAVARPLVGRRRAKTAAWLYALWPTAIYWSAVLLKDMYVAFWLALSSAFWVRYAAGSRRVGWLGLAFAATLPLVKIRPYAFGFMALGLGITVLVGWVVERRWWRLAAAAALVAASWSLPARLAWIDDRALNIIALTFASDLVVHGSAIGALVQAGASNLLILPVAMFKFLVSPIPWKASEPYVVPGAIAQFAIMPLALRGGWVLIRRRWQWVLPFVVLTLLTDVIHAIVFRGAIPRHMHMFYSYMMICAVAGAAGWRHWALYVGIALGLLGAGAVGASLLG